MFNNGQPKMSKSAIEPRGLRRADAAHYIGVSPTTFDGFVKSEQGFPSYRLLKDIKVWDRRDLDRYFDDLPNPKSSSSPANYGVTSDWDEIL